MDSQKNNKHIKVLDKLRTIFIGTPDFAIPSLKSLLNDPDFEVLGVITQPDKKSGRKQELTPSPVKALALEKNITVWQPEKIKDFQIPPDNIDLIVVVAYAQIIPELLLNFPKYGCINVHGSLLPKYRGAACIQAAIANGDDKTGVTIMKMNKGLDTGPIIFQSKIEIENTDTAGSLFDRLSDSAGKILPGVIKKYINKELLPVDQDDSKASYVGMLKKNDGKIEWFKDAEEVERFIRSRQPWPGSWSLVDNKTIKINEVVHSPIRVNTKKLGELFISENTLAVQCGKDALEIRKIQLEGKKETIAEDFLNGHKDYIGKILS